MVEVKIPKIYIIEKEQIEKYFTEILIDQVLYFLSGNPLDDQERKMSWLFKIFWDKIKGPGCVMFCDKKGFNAMTDNGKKRFKDTKMRKYDEVVFVDKLQSILKVVLPILYNVYVPQIKLSHLEYLEFVKNREIINEYKLPVINLREALENIYEKIAEFIEVEYNYEVFVNAIKDRYQYILTRWALVGDDELRFHNTLRILLYISEMINLKNLIN